MFPKADSHVCPIGSDILTASIWFLCSIKAGKLVGANKASDKACGLVSFFSSPARLNYLSRMCSDVGESELERKPVFSLLPVETKGAQDLIRIWLHTYFGLPC